MRVRADAPPIDEEPGGGSPTIDLACTPAWQSMGEPIGVDGSVLASCFWDPDADGPAPRQLIIGGSFANAGGAAAGRIARWDGTRWTPMGSGLDAPVQALCTWDPDGDGPLNTGIVAAGQFQLAGGVPASRIAFWDGQSWFSLGDGFNNQVLSVTTWDPDGAGPLPSQLIAGGQFTASGASSIARLAQWTGSGWQAVGGGLAGSTGSSVSSVEVWDSDGSGPLPERLVAGGSFAGGSPSMSNVAVWNGTAWTRPGTPPSDVLKLVSWDPDGPSGPTVPRLVAGTSSQGSWQWNGSSWAQLPHVGQGQIRRDVVGLATFDPDGTGPQLASLAVIQNTIQYYLEGGAEDFQTVATWNGTAWTVRRQIKTSGGSSQTRIDSIAKWLGDTPDGSSGGMLWGGSTADVAGRFGPSFWNGTDVIELGRGIDGRVTGMTEWDPDGTGALTSRIVVTGEMTQAGLRRSRGLASWDGANWEPFPVDVPGAACVATWSENGSVARTLVVGGSFSAPQRSIARWSGSAWESFGTGITGSLSALLAWDPDGSGPGAELLVAGGQFTAAGGVPASNIAAWDGSKWITLGAGFNSSVTALTTWDPDGTGPNQPWLIAVGNFTRSGTEVRNRIAAWNGSEWLAIGTDGVGSSVLDVTTWDIDGNGPASPSLVIVGHFTAAGATSLPRIGVWNGVSWATIGGGSNVVPVSVRAWDPDGSGPALPHLVVGGSFTSINGVAANRIAVWDGSVWSPLGTGLAPRPFLSFAEASRLFVSSVGVAPGGAPLLHVGGSFGSAGGVASPFAARWGCEGPTQPAAADLIVADIATDKVIYEPGEDVRVTARLKNLGPAATVGGRVLAAYFTQQSSFDSTARLVATRTTVDAIVSGGESLVEFIVPAPTDGPGFFRTALGVYPQATGSDPDYSNNVSVSATLFEVGLIEMTLGQTRTFSIDPGVAVKLRIADASSALTVRAAVRASPAANTVETRFYRSGAAIAPELTRSTSAAGALAMLLPNDRGPAYLDLLPRATGSGPTSVEITVTEAPFSIDGIVPAVAHTDVSAILSISGAAFPADARTLLMDGESIIEEATVTRHSPVRIGAAFTMLGALPREYKVRVVSPSDGASIDGADHIEVRPRADLPLGGLRVDLNIPSFVSRNRPFPISVTHANRASIPLIPPVLVLRGPNGFERRIVVTGQSGDLNSLLPDEAGSFFAESKFNQDGTKTFVLSKIAAEGPFDWAGFESRNRPAEITPHEWSTAVAAARSVVGDTWESILAFSRGMTQFTGGDLFGEDLVTRAVTEVVTMMLYSPAPIAQRGMLIGPFDPEPTLAVVRRQPRDPSKARWIVSFHGWAGFGSEFSSPGAGARTIKNAVDAMTGSAEDLGEDVGIIEVSYDSRVSDPSVAADRARQAGKDAVQMIRGFGVNDPSRVTAFGHSNGTHAAEAMGAEFFDKTQRKLGRIIAGNPPSIAGTLARLKGNGASDYVLMLSGSALDAYRGFTAEERADLERAGVRVTQGWLTPTDPDSLLKIDMHSRTPQLFARWLSPGATAAQREFAIAILLGFPVPTTPTEGGYLPDFQIDAEGNPVGIPACSDINPAGCRGPKWDANLGPIPEQEIDRSQVEVVTSADPNDIVGPTGFGPEGWIASDTDLLYTIRFENLASATAPAQEIGITQPLDADLDDASVEFVAFGLRDRVFSIQNPSDSVDRRIDLRNEAGVFADARLSFDPSTRTIRAEFLAVDPLSLTLPFDPFKGILPPNATPPQGEGFLVYRVRPRTPVVQGTEVSARASIVFDLNDAIETPTVRNRFDISAPATRLAPIDPASGTDVELRPELLDPSAGAPATEYLVYRSINDGPMQQVGRYPIAQQSVVTPIQTLARNRFVVYGLDAVGNIEPPKSAAGTVTTIGADLNSDGILDSEDFFVFFNRWLLADPATDVNGDSSVDELDVQVFLSALQESV